jgi:5-methylcytosine-specific restriction endonuclease McrA
MKRSPIKKISKKRQKELQKEAELRQILLIKQRGLCAECGSKPDWRGLSLSHTIPKSQGGRTTLANCQLLCGKCHSRRHGIDEQ